MRALLFASRLFSRAWPARPIRPLSAHSLKAGTVSADERGVNSNVRSAVIGACTAALVVATAFAPRLIGGDKDEVSFRAASTGSEAEAPMDTSTDYGAPGTSTMIETTSSTQGGTSTTARQDDEWENSTTSSSLGTTTTLPLEERVDKVEERVTIIEDRLSTTTTQPTTTSTTKPPVRTVKISVVVRKGSGDFSDIPNQPFWGRCHPAGIVQHHQGGQSLWETDSGIFEFDEPLVLTFVVPADQQVWCAFGLTAHKHWDRVTDVQKLVNGASHPGTSVECLMPAPGKPYKRTAEGTEYLPGVSAGCDVEYTVIN